MKRVYAILLSICALLLFISSSHARYYEPKVGRYLRADPIGLEGGINLYAYAKNNPVNWVDPLGLDPFGLNAWDRFMPVAGVGIGRGGGGMRRTSFEVSLQARIDARITFYPKAIDPRTGRNIRLPSSIVKRVPKSERVCWGPKQRGEFIREWHKRGYPTPRGGWDKYDIHHVHPREYGGKNDFWNLVPVERTKVHPEFNSFWRQFEDY